MSGAYRRDDLENRNSRNNGTADAADPGVPGCGKSGGYISERYQHAADAAAGN